MSSSRDVEIVDACWANVHKEIKMDGGVIVAQCGPNEPKMR